MDLDKINREKHKFYLSEQKKIDSDPKYREAIIKAREITYKRVAKTGLVSNYDDYIMNTSFMTLPPDERKRLWDYWANMSFAEFFNLK